VSENYVAAPSNMRELEDFYRQLWTVRPWVFQKQVGVAEQGGPIMVYLSHEELDREVRRSAAAVGWTVPEARWDDVPF